MGPMQSVVTPPGLRSICALLAVGSVLALACQPASRSAEPGATSPQRQAPQHVLRIVTNDLPINFSAKPLAAAGGASGVFEASAGFLMNATLAFLDARGGATPYLAESLPQFDTATWKVSPDGQMETTYRLKPSLTWHDGHPLTA